jgi:hypothetical protein
MRLKELQDLIIKEFGDEDNNINLPGLDFSGKYVNLSYMKAKRIYNDNQKAENI